MRNLKKDFYEILGLTKGADEQAIKKAYRKLAKKYHPDTNEGDKDAAQKFREVSEAYEILSDPEKKKLYDLYGMAAFDEGAMYENARRKQDANGGRWQQWSGGPGTNGRRWHWASGNFSDENAPHDDFMHDSFMYGNFENAGERSGWFHDIFQGMRFGRQGKGAAYEGFSSRSSKDLHADLTVSFREAALGCEKTFSIDTPGPTKISVHIPAGIEEGKTLRLKGKGLTDGQDGRPGDLLLQIHIEADPVYERQGKDVYTSAQIPFTTAVLGGKVKMHTLHGTVECHIPAGTQSGSKIRLKNKGIVSMKNKNEYGDEYITIQIQVPKTPSAEELDLIRELADLQQASHKRNSRRAAS